MQYFSLAVKKYLCEWTKIHYSAVLCHIDTQMSSLLTYTDIPNNPAHKYTHKHTLSLYLFFLLNGWLHCHMDYIFSVLKVCRAIPEVTPYRDSIKLQNSELHNLLKGPHAYLKQGWVHIESRGRAKEQPWCNVTSNGGTAHSGTSYSASCFTVQIRDWIEERI